MGDFKVTISWQEVFLPKLQRAMLVQAEGSPNHAKLNRDWVSLNMKWALYRRSQALFNESLSAYTHALRVETKPSGGLMTYHELTPENRRIATDVHLYLECYLFVARSLLDLLASLHQGHLYPCPPCRCKTKRLMGGQFDFFGKDANSDALGIAELFRRDASWFERLRDLRTHVMHYDATMLTPQRVGNNRLELFVNIRLGQGGADTSVKLSDIVHGIDRGLRQFCDSFENVYCDLINRGIAASIPRRARREVAKDQR